MKFAPFFTALFASSVAFSFSSHSFANERFSFYAKKTFAETFAKAQAGDAEKQYSLCVHYQSDSDLLGTIKDINEAIKWCEKAAKQHHLSAMRSLGHLYDEQAKYSQAFKWWQKLAYTSLEDYIAFETKQFAQSFFNKGKTPDEHRIRKDANFAQASDRYNLAVYYLNGRGTEKNYQQVKYWAEKIVNENNSRFGDHLLGDLYQYGLAVRIDKYKAIEFYGEACDGAIQSACDQYRKLKEAGY